MGEDLCRTPASRFGKEGSPGMGELDIVWAVALGIAGAVTVWLPPNLRAQETRASQTIVMDHTLETIWRGVLPANVEGRRRGVAHGKEVRQDVDGVRDVL